MRQIYLLLVGLSFFLSPCLHGALNATNSDTFPVLHEGRFRPSETYAQQWLNEIYNQSSLTQEHADRLALPDTNASTLLWYLNFNGHEKALHLPLFWIDNGTLKSLLDLPLERSRFSYQELQASIFSPESPRTALLELAALHAFIDAYQAPTNRSLSPRQELSSLAPGLWVELKQGELRVIQSTEVTPWNQLEVGMQLGDGPGSLTATSLNQSKNLVQVFSQLLLDISRFEQLKGAPTAHLDNVHTLIEHTQSEGLPPEKIAQRLQETFPLESTLPASGSLFHALPSSRSTGSWLPLHALLLQEYNPDTEELEPISNFTAYPPTVFQAVQSTYLELFYAFTDEDISSFDKERIDSLLDQLGLYLLKGYEPIAGTAIQSEAQKTLYYPSKMQILAESTLYRYPFIPIIIALYALAFLQLTWNMLRGRENGTNALLLLAFVLHTALLAVRCFILNRPPVSNMAETILYVPWVTVAFGLVLQRLLKTPTLSVAASCTAMILLGLLHYTGLDRSMENVQAVLDSQYWLIVHVLMVVGSYGIFLLSGVLGHLYLLYLFKGTKASHPTVKSIGNSILQTMYLGTAFLIPGTILGGVWAAESWGRFWDWDPKESWAFISAAIYLLWIHAYHFGLIRYTGLAIGSIVGLIFVSFTWYGVNYILGTGLHSYGFGTGGDVWYYSYLTAEILILTIFFIESRRKPRARRRA